MSDNTWQDLTNIFRSTLDDEALTLSESTTAKDVSGWDSITHVLLVVAVEKHFKIKLTAGEIQKLQNVGELVALIRAKKSVTGAK
ncbi:MAG TPA: acyl carrier protein [Candidatus Sulfotelmatobacter sp.]|nr:acyl carrier protein [Candidatus Sulfotelmatobacter sp.]